MGKSKKKRKPEREFNRRYYIPVLFSVTSLFIIPVLFAFAGMGFGLILLKESETKKEKTWSKTGIILGAMSLALYLIVMLSKAT